MAAIKGWVYLIFGALMIASSQLGKVETKTGHKPLWIFLYVGILFIIIGIGKYIFKRGAKNEQNTRPVNRAMTQEQIHQQHRTQHRAGHSSNQQMVSSSQQQQSNFFRGQHQVQPAGEQPVQHPSIIACPLCGTRHYDYAHYCMKCGTMMKSIRER